MSALPAFEASECRFSAVVSVIGWRVLRIFGQLIAGLPEPELGALFVEPRIARAMPRRTRRVARWTPSWPPAVRSIR